MSCPNRSCRTADLALAVPRQTGAGTDVIQEMQPYPSPGSQPCLSSAGWRSDVRPTLHLQQGVMALRPCTCLLNGLQGLPPQR